MSWTLAGCRKNLLILSVFILCFATMTQKLYSKNKDVIQNGYLIGTRVDSITNRTLIFAPYLQGVGGVTWIFEISDEQLAIVDFRWNVRPNQIPVLHAKYKKLLKGVEVLTANLEYKTVSKSIDTIQNESWVNLIGYVEKNIKVDIKRKYPYWSDLKDPQFIELLRKYGLEIKKLTM